VYPASRHPPTPPGPPEGQPRPAGVQCSAEPHWSMTIIPHRWGIIIVSLHRTPPAGLAASNRPRRQPRKGRSQNLSGPQSEKRALQGRIMPRRRLPVRPTSRQQVKSCRAKAKKGPAPKEKNKKTCAAQNSELRYTQSGHRGRAQDQPAEARRPAPHGRASRPAGPKP